MTDPKPAPVVELKAPEGKTRVVAFDSNNYRRLVGDYDSPGDAMNIAKGHNEQRKRDDDAYYVYDSAGNCLRNPGSARSTSHE